MKIAAAIGAALVLALGACDLHFTEPPRDTPARLFLSISSSDSLGGIVRLTGSLVPGFTEGGVPRHVENDALALGSEELLPARVDANGVRSYHKEWPIAAFSSNPLLTVRAPRVAGVQTTPPSVEVRIPHRIGPARLQVPSGAPIQLRIGGVQSPLLRPIRAFWELVLYEPSGRMRDVHVRSDDFPPSTISIPTEWLPASAGPDLYARLLIHATAESAPGSYMVTLLLNAGIFWSIQRDGG